MSDGEESHTIDPELELTESTGKAKVESIRRVSETTTSSNFNDSQQIVKEVLNSASHSTDEIVGQLDSFNNSSDLLSPTDILVSGPLEVKDKIGSDFPPELINVDLEHESSRFEPSTPILDFTTVSLTTKSNFESSSEETISGVSSESSELEPIVKSFLAPTGPTLTFLRSSLSPSVTEPSFKPSTPIEPSPITLVVKDPRDRITEGTEFLNTTESPALETVGEPTERLVYLLDNIDTTETTDMITFPSDQTEDRQQSVPSELNFFQDPIELTSDTDLFSFDNVEGSAESNTTELEEDSEFYDDGEFDSIWNSDDLVDYNFDELEGLGDIISDYGLSKESDDPDKKESQEDLWAKFDARFENKLKSPVDTLQDVGIGSGAIETVATLTDRSKDVGSVDGSHRRKPLVGSPTLKHEDVEEFQYKSLSPEDFHVGLSGDGHIRLGKYISFDEILEVQDVPDFTPLAQKVSNFTDFNHICQKCTLTGELAFHNEDNQFDLIRTREFLIQVDNYLQRFFEDELAYTDNYVELGNATRFDQAVILDFKMTFNRPVNESFVRNSFHSYLNEQTLADLEVIPNSSALVFQRFQINEPIVRTMGIEIKPPTYRSRLWLEVSIALMICLSISLIVLQHRKCQGIPKELPPKSLTMIKNHINEANEFELALTNYNKTKAEEEPPKVVLEDPAEEVDEIEVSLMETQMVKGFGSNSFRPVEVVWAEKQSQSREVKSHTPESSKSQKPSKVPRKSKATCSQEVKPEIHAAPSEGGQTGEPTKSAARHQHEPSVRPKQPYQPPTKPRRSSRKKEGSDSD
ncbi:hypothetical protein TCAL_15763 [Tigriopus californicus]|uniref:SEA domain-containing protein n=2 Tax=Tigriopus californicus TaxID=6832 RepID=A0A553P7A4_TIGCA|nr:hypothetical protein TCAL_15763 [Tigriopus californicus]